MSKEIIIISQSIYNYQNYNRIIEIAKGLIKHDYKIVIVTTTPTSRVIPKFIYENDLKIVLSPEFLPRKFKVSQIGILDSIYRIFFCLSKDYKIYYFEGHRPTILLPFFFTKIFKKNKVFLNEWMDWFEHEKRSYFNPLNLYDRLIQVKFRDYFDVKIVISRFLYRLLLKKKVNNVYYLPTGTHPKHVKFYERMRRCTKNRFFQEIKICIIKVDSDDISDFKFALKALGELSEKVNLKLKVYITTAIDLSAVVDKYKNLTSNLVINCVGYVEDYWTFLTRMDIALLPFSKTRKNFAKFPNKFNDFISIGLPTVFHPTGELLYLYRRFSFGTVDTEYSTHNFSNILWRLINDREFYLKESKKAFDASLELNWDTKVGEFAKYLAGILKSRNMNT